MYKIFVRDDSNVLTSLISTFEDSAGDVSKHFSEFVFKYQPDVWNKGNYPFLGFDTRKDAEDWIQNEIFLSDIRYIYEIWYCHAREISPVSYVIDPYCIQFSELVKYLWGGEWGGGSYMRSAPLGTMSCVKVKPIKHVSTCTSSVQAGAPVPVEENN